MPFLEHVRMKCLLWSDRHCCLCKAACSTDIEVHHIDRDAAEGRDEIDNAIPLCFVCHARVAHYNDQHPRGNKFKPEELKKRREQVYEEFTRHLVPPIHFEVTQAHPRGNGRFVMPEVGFVLRHLGDSLPVRVFVHVEAICNEDKRGPPDKDYYAGKKAWRLNPRMAYKGHFTLPGWLPGSNGRIEVEVKIAIEDWYGRQHSYLPVGFVYKPEIKDWYFEP